jgi:hypothetical protein
MGGTVRWSHGNCCKMSGVFCTDGLVTQLHWINHGLTGSIPSEIGNLFNLEEL